MKEPVIDNGSRLGTIAAQADKLAVGSRWNEECDVSEMQEL